MGGGDGRRVVSRAGFSFVACLGGFAIDHAPLARRSIAVV